MSKFVHVIGQIFLMLLISGLIGPMIAAIWIVWLFVSKYW